MSYSRPQKVRDRRGRVRWLSGLGAGLDEVKAEIDKMNQLECIKTANASPAVAAIDAKTEDLARNWRPTGFYAPSEVQTLITTILASTSEARAALASAPMSTRDAATMVKQAHYYLDLNVEKTRVYQNALAQAQAQGANVIDAPGIKDWVLKAMVNISHAFTTIAALSCRTTWLDRAASVVSAIWGVAKRIVGIAIKVGDTVLKAADDILDLYPIIKWGALGVGALFVLREIQKRRGA